MAQFRAVASTVMGAILSCGAVAHGQSFATGTIGISDADPPLDAELLPPVDQPRCAPPVSGACTHCRPAQCTRCQPAATCPHCLPAFLPNEVSEDELEAVLIGGVSAA